MHSFGRYNSLIHVSILKELFFTKYITLVFKVLNYINLNGEVQRLTCVWNIPVQIPAFKVTSSMLTVHVIT